MNSIWNKNIHAFKYRFPALADFYHSIIEDITAHGDDKNIFSFWNIMPAKNGSLTAQIDNMLLHSSYNPEREAMSTAAQLAAKNKETVIFMGAGLGWQICSMAKLIKSAGGSKDCPVNKIVLIEPDPIHFFGALFYIDWSDVFDIEQLVIALGCPVDSLMGLLEGNKINIGNSGLNAAYVYAIPAFIMHARPYFDSAIALIERNRNKNDINTATYKKFERLWIRNSMKNIVQLEKLTTIKEFALAYKNKTENFIVAAAGPSLEGLLPKLKAYKEKAVIVCVETALHALLKNGIEPDFIVITDPQYYAYKHIAGLQAQNSILVCPLSVYPSVFRFKCRQILLCSEMFPVSSYFENKLGEFGNLGAGGSVASSAWNLCRLLGAKNIYFAGLDLSYPKSQTHIKGSTAEESLHASANRLTPAQAQNSLSRFSANPEYAFDYNGKEVLTDARMKMFAWWFESNIAANPGVNTYTLSPYGMKIQGIQLVQEIKGDQTKAQLPTLAKSLAGTERIIGDFYRALKDLSALINQALEKCIVGGQDLGTELQTLDSKIASSPLAEIVRLANPDTADKTKAYSQLQKTMQIYMDYAI